MSTAERALPKATLPLPVECIDKNGQPFVVREYVPEDRPRLEAFYEAFEPKRTAQGLPPHNPAGVQRWLDKILLEGTHLIVKAGAELIGHAFLVPTGREREAEYAIFLARAVRGQGVGTQVNRITIDVARAQGLETLWLSVEPHNRAAIRSYEKVGYEFIPGSIFDIEAEMKLEL
jgi:RimJ/RimL family protein N-acetyltransferase